MSFESGSISFQRYAVVGQSPTAPTEELLKKLEAAEFAATLGLPLPFEYGWAGARHVLDATFDFENCVFNDCIHFALRVDTNKVPPPLVKAYTAQEEIAAAAGNPSGFISKSQKRIAKDAVERKCDEELRSGRFRRSKLVTLLWDVPAGILYGPAGRSDRQMLAEIFERTFKLELHPLTSGLIAAREMERLGKRGQYEDFTPTRFARSAEDFDSPAEYPWTAKGDGAKDFLGNEFLLWLWHESRTRGVSKTDVGDVSMLFDRSLQLDCVFGQTGKDTFVAAGPTQLLEVFDALRSGKVPRRAGLIIDCPAGQFTLAIAAETLAITGLRLPEIEKAESMRHLFEERITLLRDFCRTLDALFNRFRLHRAGNWAATVETISTWINTTRKK